MLIVIIPDGSTIASYDDKKGYVRSNDDDVKYRKGVYLYLM